EPLHDVTRTRRDDVKPEDAARPRVEDDLVEAEVGVEVGRAPDGREWVNYGLDVFRLLAGLRLGQTDGRELRLGEDRGRQRRIVRRRWAEAEHVVDGDPRLVLRGGGERRLPVDVAGGPDPGDARAHERV